MDKLPPQIQTYVKSFDNELNKIPMFVQFEQKSKVPKVYAVAGASSVFFLMIFFNIFGDLLSNLLGFVYPAYMSFKAIESPGRDDDKQWYLKLTRLTYWVVFGCLNLIEYFSDMILYWMPFYFFFKCTFRLNIAALCLYLALPQTRGAEAVYQKVIKPFVLKAESEVKEKTS
jgi:receptor expression-enhancing protein 5/6